MKKFNLSNILFNIVIFHFINVSGTDFFNTVFNVLGNVAFPFNAVHNANKIIAVSTQNQMNTQKPTSEEPRECVEAFNPEPLCNIYTSKCIDSYYSPPMFKTDGIKPFFVQHNFTLDAAWKHVGKMIHCKNGACSLEYTMKIDKSTQIEYGNEKSVTRSSTVGRSESFSNTLTVSANAGFSAMGVQAGGSIENSEQYGREQSIQVTLEKGSTLWYSTSTANTIGFEEKITCHGVQNEKIFIQSRTNMTRMTGNYCEYHSSLRCVNKNYFKCNYVDLRMYPVRDENIFTELACNRVI